MQRMTDLKMARMIAYKRLITGSLALMAGVVTTIIGLGQHPMTGQLGLALVIFFGGGAWTLRDGLRLRREIKLAAGR